MVQKFAETIGHYNVYRKNSPSVVARDVALMTSEASVFSLNEVQPFHTKELKALLKARSFGYAQVRTNMLCWDKSIWGRQQWRKATKLCGDAESYGYEIPVHPARYLLSQSLEHRASERVHHFEVTHLPQGYAKVNGGGKPRQIARLEDLQAMEAIHRLDIVTTQHVGTRRGGFHHLLGDMNARTENKDRRWYPGVALADVWAVGPELDGSIDWILHSQRSTKNGLEVIRRYTKSKHEGFDSDHAAQFKRVKFPSLPIDQRSGA